MEHWPLIPRAAKQSRSAFTLVEMLLVVTLITILIALLLPGLGRARDSSESLQCMTKQRRIGHGLVLFGIDHMQKLPGCYAPPWSGPEMEKRSWMGNEAWNGVAYEGAVVPYVGGADSATQLYRCPSLNPGPLQSGIGSNGRFDYTMLLVFSGARFKWLPEDSTWQDPISGVLTLAPTPLIVEERPDRYVNACCVDPGHANIDEVGTWHDGGSNYITVDGSSVRIQPSGPIGPNTHQWTTRAPSGAFVTLTSHGSGYGGWNKR